MPPTTLPTSTEPGALPQEAVSPTFFHLLFPTMTDALRWVNALAGSVGGKRADSPASYGQDPASPADRVVAWVAPTATAGPGLAHAYVSRAAVYAAVAACLGVPVLELVTLRWLPAGLRLAVGTDADARLYDARSGAAA